MDEQLKFYKNKLSFEMDSADLYEGLSTNLDIVVIDTRKSFAYSEVHIPGAINLPHKDMNVESTKGLDISKTYICYCDGIGCNGSTKGALKMTQLGFKTKELIGGLDWWKRDGHKTEGSKSNTGRKSICGC